MNVIMYMLSMLRRANGNLKNSGRALKDPPTKEPRINALPVDLGVGGGIEN
jgi:hypothetical protein